MEKINELSDILIERLPVIKRWLKVEVTDWENADERVKDVYPKNSDMIYVFWNGRKSATNHHDYEIKEFPVRDIDLLIQRNTERLRNERKVYK